MNIICLKMPIKNVLQRDKTNMDKRHTWKRDEYQN